MLHTKFARTYSFDLSQHVEIKICYSLMEDRKFQKSAKKKKKCIERWFYKLTLWYFSDRFLPKYWVIFWNSHFLFQRSSRSCPQRRSNIIMIIFSFHATLAAELESVESNQTGKKMDVWINSTVWQCWMCGDIGVRRPTILWHSDIGLASHTVELILLRLAECI